MPRVFRQRGFTLVELLIVVAIIGILATIAIPNLIMAIQRTRQKRTMADMRSIGTSWEARATDMGSFEVAGSTFTMPPSVTHDQLSVWLAPTYLRKVPQFDGWSNPYAMGSNDAHYGIRSTGKDLLYETSPYVAGTRTTDFECDIVFSNGSFVQFPDGVQAGAD